MLVVWGTSTVGLDVSRAATCTNFPDLDQTGLETLSGCTSRMMSASVQFLGIDDSSS